MFINAGYDNMIPVAPVQASGCGNPVGQGVAMAVGNSAIARDLAVNLAAMGCPGAEA